MSIEFTEEELMDIRVALLLAMKQLDKVGRPADKKMADRFELIEEKILSL